jgi:hypothetical protein
MNERIQKLAEQANAHETGHAYYRGEKKPENAVTLHSVDLEKFAELIVKECMEQVWYTREDGINGNVSQVIKDRIKEHFGVEE